MLKRPVAREASYLSVRCFVGVETVLKTDSHMAMSLMNGVKLKINFKMG